MGGTKLNLDYVLNDMLEEDRAEDLFDYFRTTQHDNLDEAIRELADDYSREEVILMRLKYLSVMGN
jgi:ATP-dependent DNA helicase RecQ